MLTLKLGIINDASAPASDTVGVWQRELPRTVPLIELVVELIATSNSVPVLAPVREPIAVTSQSPAVNEIEVTVFGVAVVRATALP